MPEEKDDGSRIRIKMLYVFIALLAGIVIVQWLQIASIGGSVNYLQNNQVQKYDVDNLKSSITSIQNRLDYQVPAKYEFDNLVTRMNNCKCY